VTGPIQSTLEQWKKQNGGGGSGGGRK